MPHRPLPFNPHQHPTSEALRIVLADDFQPWRLKLRSFLEAETDWQIVFEACDGAEAVQRTAEMRPDVVILDVSMPRLNGIEAARTIRSASPQSTIIILSQSGDVDVMNVALEAGAEAYVLKANMTTELIPAVQVALRAKRAN